MAERPCKVCGQPMPPDRPARKRVVCSYECRILNLHESKRITPGVKLTQAERNTRYRAKHPERMSAHKRKHRLRAKGLSLEWFAQRLALQDGGCEICGARHVPGHVRRSLVTDHCHETGKFRGLLCHSCNRAIGLLKDNPALLLAASAYLRKYGR